MIDEDAVPHLDFRREHTVRLEEFHGLCAEGVSQIMDESLRYAEHGGIRLPVHHSHDDLFAADGLPIEIGILVNGIADAVRINPDIMAGV